MVQAKWVTAAFALVLLVGVAGTAEPARAGVEARRQRIVSTSGIPHADVANYRLSPMWKTGMPKGANRAWRRYLRTTVSQVSAGANTVLHQGDMVEGRWGLDVDRAGVFGPVRTYRQRYRAVGRAADTIYPWIKSFWAGRDVLWGMGDHEVGDIGSAGVVPPSDFRYRAHRAWNTAWERTFGNSRHANRRGRVGVITLDPIAKTATGLRPRVRSRDLEWMRTTIHEWRTNGVRWVLVQSEIPAIGPNAERGTSGLLLQNGRTVWRQLRRLDVDLLLAAEFHADTAHTHRGHTPMQVVHGGARVRASWLVVDEYDDRLQLTLKESEGTLADSTGTIWAPSAVRVGNRPVAGSTHRTGRATIWRDGRITNRTGRLVEG